MDRKIIALSSATLLLCLGAAFWIQTDRHVPTQPPVNTAPPATTTEEYFVLVGDTRVHVEVVATQAAKQKGLSGRSSLADGKGMLFVYDKSDRYGFWMPDMHFAIDIIWLDSTWHVVHVKENATPDSYPEVFKPVTSAQYILEVPAGYAREHGIVVGVQAVFK